MEKQDELSLMNTTNRNNKEYLAGRACGLLHMPNDQLCRDNLAKIQSGINATGRPMVQAYWRGYLDGMKNEWNFAHFYQKNS